MGWRKLSFSQIHLYSNSLLCMLVVPTSFMILALLDYVSRAHEIEICPSSVVRRSCHNYRYPILNRLLSSFSCCFPWAICRETFWFSEKQMHFTIFPDGFFFVFVNKEPYGSNTTKRYSSLKWLFESFQTFSEFSSQWSSQKYCFEFFRHWTNDF